GEPGGVDAVGGDGEAVREVDVGRREAELRSPAALAVDDFAGDAVGPAEAFGGGGDVAVGEVAADAGGGDALALELHEVDDVDVDAEGLRVPRQGGGVAAGLVAVGEVLADEDGARV